MTSRSTTDISRLFFDVKLQNELCFSNSISHPSYLSNLMGLSTESVTRRNILFACGVYGKRWTKSCKVRIGCVTKVPFWSYVRTSDCIAQRQCSVCGPSYCIWSCWYSAVKFSKGARRFRLDSCLTLSNFGNAIRGYTQELLVWACIFKHEFHEKLKEPSIGAVTVNEYRNTFMLSTLPSEMDYEYTYLYRSLNGSQLDKKGGTTPTIPANDATITPGSKQANTCGKVPASLATAHMSKWQYGMEDLAIIKLKNAAKDYYEKLKYNVTVKDKVLVYGVKVPVEFGLVPHHLKR